MNTAIRHAALAAGLAIAFAAPAALAAGFNYHGNLRDGAQPAEGRYDLRVTLYGGEHAIAPAAAPVTLYGVEVHEGRFSTAVDFAQDAPADAWLGVAVRKAGSGEFVELAGRSAITGADACWLTNGNSGTDGLSNYLGTTDNASLTIAVNNGTAARFTPYASGAAFQASYGTADAGRAAAVNYGTAHATDSFAGGYSGRVLEGHDRSFVWGGTSRVPYVDSAAPDQFVVWADNGFVINSSAVTSVLDDLVVYPHGGNSDTDPDIVLVTTSGRQGRLYVENDAGTLVLEATGGVHITDPVAIDGGLMVDGRATKATAGAWQANSDGRIKQDITPVEDAIDTLAKVRPVTFRYTDAYRAEHPGVADQRYYNVIAQEFATVFPDAVTRSGEYLPGTAQTPDNEILQVDTYPAQIVTIAAVQELAQKNARLEDMVARLSARLARLEASKGK